MPTDRDSGEITFHCRSPIYMCPDCSKARSCADLLNILKIFSFEVKKTDEEYLDIFPFMKAPPEDARADPRNKLNELTSGEWLTFTRTVISASFPKTIGHALRRKHPDYKSPFLLGQFIAFFTKPGELVLDPFAGTGTSLLAASILGRDAVGFEFKKKWCDIYYAICEKEEIQKQKLVHGHCAALAAYLPAESTDFIIMDPPDPTKPGEWLEPDEPQPASPMDTFFAMFDELARSLNNTLRTGKYMAVFTKNLYHDGHYEYITPRFAESAEKAGFILKGEKVWENKAEKLRPFGYPHSYIPNIVHFNILIFQKNK